MQIKRRINLLKMRFGKKTAVDIAREIGVRIGERCEILSNPYYTFGSEPYLVTLGNHVKITSGVQFVTHDGGAWIIRDDDDCEKIDVFGKIVIGNNVFIGINAIIMPGVEIGDDVCIAAGAVVTRNIPPGQVWGGVPAHYIKSYEMYKTGLKEKCDYTKDMSAEEKKQTLIKLHPDWFDNAQ